MKTGYQAAILLVLAVTLGLYLRSVVLDDLMTAHDDGCMEAAGKLYKSTGSKFLFEFCEARAAAIREYGEK